MKTKSLVPSPKTSILFVAAALLSGFFLSSGPTAHACGDYESVHLFKLAILAASPDRAQADDAIADLRQEGQRGLDALFTIHATKIWQHLSGTNDTEWPSIRLALEKVSGQRDCAESHLFWHTNLELARAEAAKSAKPILSLRLLGRLDEELSCANSRFFRTALYANEEVSRVLREQFVLHWESVRPVPRITIEFGDGRRLERTITGNSIHYVLDAEGRPLDALPGLNGPKAFLGWLDRVRTLDRELAAAPGETRDSLLAAYHAGRTASLNGQWQQDIQQAGLQVSLPKNMTDADWTKLALLHAEDARLDASSRRLVARKHPDALVAGRIAFSKAVVESPVLRATREFERSIAEDTVRNEYELHAAIHDWFATVQPVTQNLNALNDRVYAELFLTPRSDPWLGLRPEGVYSALDCDGVTMANRK